MDEPQKIGDWQQISVLGTGAFGTVTLWCNRKENDFVAIKKCKFQKTSSLSPKQKERWKMEVDFMRSVRHPNIIAFKKLDPVLEEMMNKHNPSKLPLLSMEYCQKGNLRHFLNNEPIKLCGLQEHDVRCILEDISNGLDYLHGKNITHRDIKPDNIVLQHWDGRRGETLYKIIDLGYAKELQDSTLSFVGTLHYLAPEIFANADYNHTVDYWSMGIMVFEIICGVLPFLPELNPFERFEKIKNKNPNDICIYFSYSGSMMNSSELKKEHFVTSCFKQNIETWLRKVLQLDPSRRLFGNDVSTFDHLRYILDKKIIRVFYVFKLEYYSYEICEGTLLGTLKDWISRDINIPKSDFLLLLANSQFNLQQYNDETLVESLLHPDDGLMIYIYKKDCIFSKKFAPKVPHPIKDLFVSNFKQKFTRQLYRQALFYVHTEMQAVESFKSAYFHLIQFIKADCDRIKDQYITASKKLGLLLDTVGQFLKKKKQNGVNNNADLGENDELVDCLKYFERLLSSVERREENLKEFGKQVKFLRSSRSAITDAEREIESIFCQCDLRSQFDLINGKAFLEKRNGETDAVLLTRIKDVINNTTKSKSNLFNEKKNEKFATYSQDFCCLLKTSEQFSDWVENFIKVVDELLIDLLNMEKKYDSIVCEALTNQRREFSLSFNQDDSLNLIKENKLLRCQFEDFLSQSVLAHKNFVDDSRNLFD